MSWKRSVPAMAILAVAVQALADSDPLVRTVVPGHLEPKSQESTDPPPWPQHVWRYDQWLVYRFPEAIGKWTTVDPRLSHLCRRGAFRQVTDFALYASSPEASYGVGFAEGPNLHDPQKLARPGMVYFFSEPETSACLVLASSRETITAFATRRMATRPATAQPGHE